MLSKIHTGIMCTQLSKKSTIGSQFLGCHWVTIFRTKGIQTSHISLWERGRGQANCTDRFQSRPSTPPPALRNKKEKGVEMQTQQTTRPVPTPARPAPASSLLAQLPAHPQGLGPPARTRLPGRVAVGSQGSPLQGQPAFPLELCAQLMTHLKGHSSNVTSSQRPLLPTTPATPNGGVSFLSSIPGLVCPLLSPPPALSPRCRQAVCLTPRARPVPGLCVTLTGAGWVSERKAPEQGRSPPSPASSSSRSLRSTCERHLPTGPAHRGIRAGRSPGGSSTWR